MFKFLFVVVISVRPKVFILFYTFPVHNSLVQFNINFIPKLSHSILIFRCNCFRKFKFRFYCNFKLNHNFKIYFKFLTKYFNKEIDCCSSSLFLSLMI